MQALVSSAGRASKYFFPQSEKRTTTDCLIQVPEVFLCIDYAIPYLKVIVG